MSQSTAAYVVDTISVPFDNPHHALMFLGGHDFFPNGDAAVSTAHGDVWLVRGIDATLGHVTWKRMATGLFQPLGLKILNGEIYVLGRDQITRLHDFNHDGETDFYENFNNDGEVTQNGHEFATCLETDSKGAFYYLRGDSRGASSHDGSLLRVAPSGGSISVFATGLRNANGMGIGPDDTITVSPQEGTWTPGSAIFAVREGDFCGMMTSHHRPAEPTTYDPPLCWIPRPLDNSSGGQVWAPATGWGPLSGDLLHLSYGRCSLLAAMRETVGSRQQGAIMSLGIEFESGAMRGRFSPRDGQLYVTGLQGWQTNAKRDGCFQRVRYTGAPLNAPVAFHFVSGGMLVTYSRPLDRAMAEDIDNYDVQAWNYRWTGAYGSPDFKPSAPKTEGLDTWPVTAAVLQPDGRTVFLAIEDLQPVMQIGMRATLKARDGEAFDSALYGTIHALGALPNDVRTQPTTPAHGTTPVVDIDAASLAAGLAVAFEHAGPRKTPRGPGANPRAARVARLAAWTSPADEAPSMTLEAGPFMAEANGFIRLDLRGAYRFSFAGAGSARLWINDAETLVAAGPDLAAAAASAEVVLHKGLNRVRIAYTSPRQGDAACRLLWSSAAFTTEPVPPTMLWHDTRDPELVASELWRAGHDLFQAARCGNCHEALGMRRPGPRFDEIGSRLRESWLTEWLLDPRSQRDDVTMPKVLVDRPEATAQRQAADIAAYLASIDGAAAPEGDAAPMAGAGELVARGETLHEDLGCIQCHRLTPPEAKDAFGRVSLANVAKKFPPGRLEQFLARPEAHFAATRMPNFHLSTEERNSLAAFVRSKVPAAQEAVSGDRNRPAPDHAAAAERGKAWFAKSGCGQCHSHGPQRELPTRVEWPKDAETKRGCLTPRATREKADPSTLPPAAPEYNFTATELAALRAFIAAGDRPAWRDAPAEIAAREMKTLRCAACHARDSQATAMAAVLDEEGTQGFPPEGIPSLTWVGEKLQTAWTKRLIEGTLPYQARPWLKARMPTFSGRGEAIALGLAAQHGMAPEDPDPVAGDRPPREATWLKTPRQLAASVDIGRELSVKQGGLDCRQCHSIDGVTQKQENNAQGVSFPHVAERMRIGYYRRWMLDPLRIDPRSKMPRFTTDRRHTAVTGRMQGDAVLQFDALWDYIHSLPAADAPASDTKP